MSPWLNALAHTFSSLSVEEWKCPPGVGQEWLIFAWGWRLVTHLDEAAEGFLIFYSFSAFSTSPVVCWLHFGASLERAEPRVQIQMTSLDKRWRSAQHNSKMAREQQGSCNLPGSLHVCTKQWFSVTFNTSLSGSVAQLELSRVLTSLSAFFGTKPLLCPTLLTCTYPLSWLIPQEFNLCFAWPCSLESDIHWNLTPARSSVTCWILNCERWDMICHSANLYLELAPTWAKTHTSGEELPGTEEACKCQSNSELAHLVLNFSIWCSAILQIKYFLKKLININSILIRLEWVCPSSVVVKWIGHSRSTIPHSSELRISGVNINAGNSICLSKTRLQTQPALSENGWLSGVFRGHPNGFDSVLFLEFLL